MVTFLTVVVRRGWISAACLLCGLSSTSIAFSESNEPVRDTVKSSPEESTKHWRRGEVWNEEKGIWLTPKQAEELAQKDQRLAEYRTRRQNLGPTLADQVELARWCGRNKLFAEERVHWTQVLQLQPGNQEAVKRLDLRPYQGRYYTNEQIARLKEQPKRLNKSIEHWRPIVVTWRKALEQKESKIPDAIREQIEGITDTVDMYGLTRAIERDVGEKPRLLREMTLALMTTLQNNPHPAAAQCLTHFAVFSGWDEVKEAAIEGLKRHPIDHYVPLLLGALQSPIEANIFFNYDGHGNLMTRTTTYQESDRVDYSVDRVTVPKPGGSDLHTPLNDSGMPGDLAFHRKNASPQQIKLWNERPKEIAAWREKEKERFAAVATYNRFQEMQAEAKIQQNRVAAYAKSAASADAFYSKIERANEAIEKSNDRIFKVLRQTTGKDIGDAPKDWWKWWWQEYNESGLAVCSDDDLQTELANDPYVPESSKPVVAYEKVDEYQGTGPTPSMPASFRSTPPNIPSHCFAGGTLVWAQLGRVPIEKICVGDRVLAQNVETGELAYKPVLGVTLRPPQRRIVIGWGPENLIATPAHPFWIDGKGWHLAKNLEVGSPLHSISGRVPIESLKSLPPDPSFDGYSYNLVVADFGSFFVGERGILVHDATQRHPASNRMFGDSSASAVAERE